jgi:hypothetical protein
MKAIFGEAENIETIQQAGKMAASVHGIEFSDETTTNEIKPNMLNVPGRMLI